MEQMATVRLVRGMDFGGETLWFRLEDVVALQKGELTAPQMYLRGCAAPFTLDLVHDEESVRRVYVWLTGEQDLPTSW
jgi:hypothetical protein